MAQNHMELNENHIDDIPINDYELSNGEIHIEPRIGDEYQAQLPKLICRSIYISPSITETNIRKFSFGLPIQLTSINSPQNVGTSDSKINGEIEPKGNLLVPGLHECWNDAEKSSFLLGLYIFLKNFVELSRFVETKGMGAIMSFYYGKFYGGAEYRRWLECRKSKSRKCVFGRRVFSGLRRQELLSRLFPKVSEELRNTLLEVSKTFGEERISLEEYVFSLKAMIGTHILVEAIAIGTGKQDLTRMAFEPSKSSQPGPLRPEIPTGKACSSLTHAEITKFLSGNYRLSKARSNDLFWEAVWPRLLARGWHSEQPNNKNCLVFLGPGIKKFSQRKLVRGAHYFDSVTDVLGKVAKDPSLIDLESDGNGDGEKIEERDVGSEKDDSESDVPKQRHSYLQPKTPKRDRNVFKFLVVDTSLSNGSVREFRSFPLEIASTFVSDGNSRGKMTVDCDVRKRVVVDTNNKKVLAEKKKFRKSLVRREVEKGDVDNLAPIKKCGKLSEETRDGPIDSLKGPKLENGSSSLSSGSFEFNENSSSRVVDKLPSTSSSRGGLRESDIQEPSHTTPMLIDLNMPQVVPGFENGEQDNGPDPKPDDNGLVTEIRPEDRPVVNFRRQSTRTRPLTAKALEALAGGYLTVNRRRKGRDPHEDVGPSSRPMKRARGWVGQNEASLVGPREAEDGPSNTVNHSMSNENEGSMETKEGSSSCR